MTAANAATVVMDSNMHVLGCIAAATIQYLGNTMCRCVHRSKDRGSAAAMAEYRRDLVYQPINFSNKICE